MAKIGTVHVEVKPVPDEAAWQATCDRLEERVAEAVRRGIERGTTGVQTFRVREFDGSWIEVEGTHLEVDRYNTLGICDTRKLDDDAR